VNLHDARKWLGLDFVHVGAIEPERDAAGTVREFMPQERYVKGAGKRLNPHGAGPFCRIRVPGAPLVAGVYVLLADGEPVYVGICRNLAGRWGSTGYGSIQPINCFVGGQSTNCKINNRILTGVKAGTAFDLYFHATGLATRPIESQLISGLRPPWNGTR
jgi:hypothetical protein